MEPDQESKLKVELNSTLFHIVKGNKHLSHFSDKCDIATNSTDPNLKTGSLTMYECKLNGEAVPRNSLTVQF